MKITELLNEDGRIVKGVNTTIDVDTDEIKTQAAKFGNSVDKDGRPPTLSSKVKGSSTNVLFNLGLSEGIILKFERDEDMDVLHIMDTTEKHRVEVRGKPGYERGNHDEQDKLHQVLDALGKAANFAELMNGETVSVNPNHPHGTRAIRTAKDVLQTEASGPRMDPKDVEFDLLDAAEKRRLAGEYKKLGPELAITTWGAGLAQGIANYLGGRYLSALERFLLRQGTKRFTEMELACIEGGHDLNDLYKQDSKVTKPGDIFEALNSVTEALDNPYPVRWLIKDDDEWEGKAKTEADDSIQIMITQGHNNHKWEIDFYVGGSMQVTGKGDQFRVFATVVSAVKEWWSWLSKSQQPVEAIIFSAFKGNEDTKGSAGRSSLYNRFANQFARSIGFEVSTVDGSDNIKFMLTNPNYKNQQTENFADGKVKGKSRPGRVKRAGASCNGSVTSLRKRAKNASGEKAKMYHWCANMKSGRKK